MARKRELEKLKDKQNQEEERRKREEKERRLRELEKKRRQAASKAVKRPLHVDHDKLSRGSSAIGAKHSDAAAPGDMEGAAIQYDVNGIVGHQALFTSTQRAQEVQFSIEHSGRFFFEKK